MSETMRLRATLAVIRLSTALFMAFWAVRKIIDPERAERVFTNFYFSTPGETLVVVFGVAQLVILIAFALGVMKLLSYGAVLAMHGVSTLSSFDRLANPFDGGNLLFWTAVPVLAALVMLFLFRNDDRMLSIG